MVQAYLFGEEMENYLYMYVYVCKKVERLDIKGKRKIGRAEL